MKRLVLQAYLLFLGLSAASTAPFRFDRRGVNLFCLLSPTLGNAAAASGHHLVYLRPQKPGHLHEIWQGGARNASILRSHQQ